MFNIIKSALQETHKKPSALGKNNSVVVKNGSVAALKNGKEESSEDESSDEVLNWKKLNLINCFFDSSYVWTSNIAH